MTGARARPIRLMLGKMSHVEKIQIGEQNPLREQNPCAVLGWLERERGVESDGASDRASDEERCGRGGYT